MLSFLSFGAMEWSRDHDINLCREVLVIELFQNTKGNACRTREKRKSNDRENERVSKPRSEGDTKEYLIKREQCHARL